MYLHKESIKRNSGKLNVLFDTKKNPQHNIHEHESCKVLINFIYTPDTSIIKQKSVTED
jgi:hypothetical protein